MSYDVHLPQFEGPLALLLYLIRKEEMDIFNINVHEITSQYLAYIRRMKQLDLETAGDFVAMAATLIQIKSQMLLPQYNEEGEEVEVEDPRKELVQRLLEYERYQKTSKRLYELPLLNRDVWSRGGRERLPEDDSEGEIIIEEGGLYPLISHYRRAIRNMKKAVHRVSHKTQSIAGRILEIKDRFVVGQRMTLKALMNTTESMREEILITFLSALELGKMGYVSLFQAETYGEIYLTTKKLIDGNVIEGVQEYDSQDAEQVADTLFEEPMPLEAAITAAQEEVEEQNQEVASDEEIDDAEKELELS